MRVLYGVCGEGFGHSSIASEVIPFLEKKGHEVKVITYGKGVEFLKDFNVFEVEGFKLNYSEGGVDYWNTVFSNVRDFPKNFFRWKEINEFVHDFQPELCVTDNEPIVATVSYLLKLPLISFSALNSFTFDDVKKPLSKQHSSLIAKTFTRAVVPRANITIGLALRDTTVKKRGRIFTSPVIRKRIKQLKVARENFVLVYLAKSHDYLVKDFEKMKEHFVVYGMNSNNQNNITFKKNPEEFAMDFAKCKAIISNAGFSVLAEAVYLRKPIFMIPVKSQYEQFYNCLVAQKKGVGAFSEEPNFEEISQFLGRLRDYREKMEQIVLDPNEPLRVIGEAVEKFEK